MTAGIGADNERSTLIPPICIEVAYTVGVLIFDLGIGATALSTVLK